MTSIWKLTLSCLLFALATAAPARAETTTEFLAKCKTDTKSCDDYITLVELLMMMDKNKRNTFCLPKGYDAAAVKTGIKDWLTAHLELQATPAAETIEKAYQAVYPETQACSDTYIRVDPFPATTEKFLAYCANEPKDAKETCYDEIVGAGLILSIDDENICPVKADTRDGVAFHKELVQRVKDIRAWLAGQSSLSTQPRKPSLEAAYRALYSKPCK